MSRSAVIVFSSLALLLVLVLVIRMLEGWRPRPRYASPWRESEFLDRACPSTSPGSLESGGLQTFELHISAAEMDRILQER